MRPKFHKIRWQRVTDDMRLPFTMHGDKIVRDTAPMRRIEELQTEMLPVMGRQGRAGMDGETRYDLPVVRATPDEWLRMARQDRENWMC